MKTAFERCCAQRLLLLALLGQILYGLLSRWDSPAWSRSGFVRVLNYAYAMDKTAAYTTSGRVPDAELVAFQVLDNGQNESGAPQGYAKDSHQVYFHNGDGKVKVIKGAEGSSFRSLGDTYFARDEKRIYAYGKQLPKAELTSWELLGHWYSRDAKRVYYLNREIKGRIGTVSQSAPRWTRLCSLTIWPATKTMFTKMMR